MASVSAAPSGGSCGDGSLARMGPALEENVFSIFNNVPIIDDFTSVVKSIILLSALSSVLVSFDYVGRQKINSFEYIILIMFPTLSMLPIVSSHDPISMYLAIELQSLSFHVLAAFQRNNEFSTEAGLKYFILGALSSGLLLFGESIIYGFTGITNFEELTKSNVCVAGPATEASAGSAAGADPSIENTVVSRVAQESLAGEASLPGIASVASVVVPIGLLFMLIAFPFKIGAVPFHM